MHYQWLYVQRRIRKSDNTTTLTHSFNQSITFNSWHHCSVCTMYVLCRRVVVLLCAVRQDVATGHFYAKPVSDWSIPLAVPAIAIIIPNPHHLQNSFDDQVPPTGAFIHTTNYLFTYTCSSSRVVRSHHSQKSTDVTRPAYF